MLRFSHIEAANPGSSGTAASASVANMKKHEIAYAIAEKQLYSSHYFETALDLSFCIRRDEDPINRSTGCRRSSGFWSPRRTHVHQIYPRK